MKKHHSNDHHGTQGDLARCAGIALVWAVFYALLITHSMSGPGQSLVAKAGAPQWRASVVDFAQLPDASRPVAYDALER